MLLSIVAVAGSYLLGAIPFGVLVGRRLGVDVQKVGSGNTGATNVWRALGPKAGAAVFALDVAKGLAGPILARGLDQSETIVAACAVAAVVGHTFSIFLRGRGGKGISTALGALVGLNAPVALAALALWGVVFGATRFISLASIFAAVLVLVLPWILGAPLAHSLVASAIGLLAIAKHVPNIQRLLAGTEPRAGAKPSAAKNDAGAEAASDAPAST
jgi:glycerol-3-phosphate acyltransferase PlsY